VSVAEYLNRARDCLDLADDVDGEFREVLLQVAGTWLTMAEMEAARPLPTPLIKPESS
jgi:hypothetical protein